MAKHVMPDGLEICPVCETVRGETEYGWRSVCLCEGIRCRWCGAGRAQRPVTDWFDPVEQRWWHVASFVPCRICVATCRRVGADARKWPPAPHARALIEAIRDAGPYGFPSRAPAGVDVLLLREELALRRVEWERWVPPVRPQRLSTRLTIAAAKVAGSAGLGRRRPRRTP